MKRVTWLIPAVLLLCLTAHAQDTPQWELFGGYSFLEANVNRSKFHLHGGSASGTENLNRWIGGRVEFSAYHGAVSGTTVSAQTITLGPVIAYRRFERLTPFAHVGFGAMHASKGYLGISASASKFAMTSGGGLDFKLKERVALRLQANYLMTRFLKLRQDNIQFMGGFVVYIGKK